MKRTEEQLAQCRANNKKYRLKYPEKTKERSRVWTIKIKGKTLTEKVLIRKREANKKSRLLQPEKDKARKRVYYKNNKESLRKSNLKRLYNMSLDDYDNILMSQGGGCAICKSKKSGSKRLFVDHCHQTGRIRGLLCLWCNTGIAYLKHDSERLLIAVDYLKQEI